ncbi:glutathione S-transferase family protein [Telluria mixta]|uniref:glutathione transferase n=1 Tax=Telluria mixta TaxID=34071 RepID=A0ABT2BX87_9BURK|nr:glutathione S-transferase family protein [Telluria mixta]MCS0629748.1 glutathione S-transferase family protein [Telluria mixta]WEM96685.1 glutathione S-transferase family protein [Telluria mixta]
MNPSFVLVSHALCPYVQRAAIVLYEKGVPFERRDVDLADKPDWFLRVSLLGKTPVLLAGGEAIFESAVICEYLDETVAPRLHPLEPLQRARHRGWMEFGSALLNAIAVFYNAPDEAALLRAADDIHRRFRQVEQVLHAPPWFDGARFCIVDAVFAPVFRYLDVFERIGDFGMLTGLARLQAWRAALALRPSVQAAVSQRYPELLTAFLARRGSALSLRM